MIKPTLVSALVATVMVVNILNAQTRGPEFDVATVKAVTLIPGQPININLGTVLNGKVTLGNVTLSDCLKFAYGIVSDAQIIGPEWIRAGDIRFDIVAQAPPDTPQDQLLVMTQALLADRLKVVVHRDKRELPFLALVVGKNGPKLGTPKVLANMAPPRLGAGRIQHDRMPMQVLAMLLSRFERQTVVDLTNLQGLFAINLQWIPDTFRGRTAPDGGPLVVNGETMDPNGPSLYTAIQEQLGLRLESRRGPVDVVVVDRAEKVPVEN
jgi:uncharacterized protein (TIGR03435 family)